MIDFSNTPTGSTRNGRPIMVSEIIAGVEACRICRGTNLVAWGLFTPPDYVTIFNERGETAPDGLQRCVAYGLCRACFDLRVPDPLLPLQWVAR